jgi:hypothetical protein
MSAQSIFVVAAGFRAKMRVWGNPRALQGPSYQGCKFPFTVFHAVWHSAYSWLRE